MQLLFFTTGNVNPKGIVRRYRRSKRKRVFDGAGEQVLKMANTFKLAQKKQGSVNIKTWKYATAN